MLKKIKEIDNILDRSLYLHSLGFSVFPLKDKKPLYKCNWGSIDNTKQTKENVINLFNKYPNANNIAIKSGEFRHPKNKKMYFIPMDYDSIKGLELFLNDFPEYKKHFLQCAKIKTNRGYHFYTFWNKDLPKTEIGKYNIDFQGGNSYIVAINNTSHKLIQDIDNFDYVISTEDINFFNVTTEKNEEKRQVDKTPIKLFNYDNFIDSSFNGTYGLGKKLFNFLITGNIKKLLDSSPEHKYLEGREMYDLRGSRSEFEYSIILKLVANGYSYKEIEQLISKMAYKNSKFRERNDILEIYYKKAVKYLSKKNVNPVKMQLYQAFCVFKHPKIIEKLLTKKRCVNTDQIVFFSILDIAKNANTILDLRISIRNICLKTGFSVRRVFNSINRLLNTKLLLRTKKGNIYSCSHYAINYQIINLLYNYYININNIYIYNYSNINTNFCCKRQYGKKVFTFELFSNIEYDSFYQLLHNYTLSYQQDCYMRGGLGKKAIDITYYLNQNRQKEYTIRDIVLKTGLNYSFILKTVKKMSQNEIIKLEKIGKTYKISNFDINNLNKIKGFKGMKDFACEIRREMSDFSEWIEQRKMNLAFKINNLENKLKKVEKSS